MSPCPVWALLCGSWKRLAQIRLWSADLIQWMPSYSTLRFFFAYRVSRDFYAPPRISVFLHYASPKLYEKLEALLDHQSLHELVIIYHYLKPGLPSFDSG